MVGRGVVLFFILFFSAKRGERGRCSSMRRIILDVPVGSRQLRVVASHSDCVRDDVIYRCIATTQLQVHTTAQALAEKLSRQRERDQ